MKLSIYRQQYYDASGMASTVSRQAAFAGIALIWIFKAQDAAQPATIVLPNELIMPSLAFIISLAFDLLQYVLGAAVWGSYCRFKEKNGVRMNQSLLSLGSLTGLLWYASG